MRTMTRTVIPTESLPTSLPTKANPDTLAKRNLSLPSLKRLPSKRKEINERNLQFNNYLLNLNLPRRMPLLQREKLIKKKLMD